MTDTALSAMGKNKSKCVIYYISVLREPLICDSDQSVSPSVYSKQLSRIQLFPLALCGSYIVRWIYIGKVFLKFLNRVSRSYSVCQVGSKSLNQGVFIFTPSGKVSETSTHW